MRSLARALFGSDRRFNRLVIVAVGLGFLLLVIAGVAAALTIVQNQRHSNWVSHTYQVERQVSHYRVLAERAETARRGYLLRTDPRITRTFADAVAGIGPTLDAIRRLTADNPRQQANVARATAISARHIASLRQTIALVNAGRRDQAVTLFNVDRTRPLMRDVRGIGDRMMAEEDRLLAIRNEAQADSLRRFFAILAVAGVLLVGVAIGSMWVILRYTRDLGASRDTLSRLNANLEGAVRERTVDLQRANEEIQRFAYIVSHDLRSPLVNVMGFTAELEAATKSLSRLVDRVEETAPETLDGDAREAARIDLPESIRFIRTSTQKMDRLINAILRLSREGRRPITPERLDMNALAGGIVDTLRHRLDELGAEIEVAPRLPEIVSDRLAVEQILSNIAENATKYLAAGRPGRIAIRGRREGDRAVFSVADNGRGIEPRDHDRIFDLFRRSGTQDQPGEGIGLAHTRALAYRLGGTIGVESTLGEGSTFTVSLPIVYAGEQGA